MSKILRNTKFLRKSSLFLTALVATHFVGCAIEVSIIDLTLKKGSIDFSDSSAFEFDKNYVEIKDGKIQLKPLELEHSGEDFNNGSHVGSHVDSNLLKLRPEFNLEDYHVNSILPNRSPELVGYWRFENNPNDSGPNNWTTTINGDTQFVSSVIPGSQAGQFDGSGDYLQVISADALKPSSVTISMWVNFQDLTQPTQFFGGLGNTSDDGYWLGTTNGINFVFNTGDGSVAGRTTSATVVKTLSLIHI